MAIKERERKGDKEGGEERINSKSKRYKKQGMEKMTLSYF